MTDFENAKAYQIDGCDQYASPEECIANWVQDCDSYVKTGRLDVRDLQPLTVYAYALAPRVKLDLDNLSDEMMTTFEEAYADANFNLTDDIDRLKRDDAYRACKAAIWDALASFEDSLPNTRLYVKPCASKMYSVEEVVAILEAVARKAVG